MALKKTNFEGYYKDTKSNVILNKSPSAFEQGKLARQRSKKLDTLSDEVQALKDDISEIKDLLRKVLNIDG